MQATIDAKTETTGPKRTGWLTRTGRQLVHARLGGLRDGGVTWIDEGRRQTFGDGPAVATVTVHDPAFYPRVMLGGTRGAAEAYLDGQWGCDDLTAFFQLLLRNMDIADRLDTGLARGKAVLARLAHLFRANTRRGSRANIHAHYDLGNDFFALFLDETMTYSCGIFESPDASMAEASLSKLDRVCRKLDLKPGDHVLEIGCGWGSFALHAARNYGCRVTGTTISRQQHEFATRRVREAGLEDRVTLLLEDYRDLRGCYDRVVSIEMIEAVGHQYLDTYFRTCARLLSAHGSMVLQSITVSDQRHAQYLRSADFIQGYVFPGSSLPCLTSLCQSITRASDLRVTHVEDITAHYARTLRWWREAFLARLDDVRRLGYSESFLRLWEYYLCSCEAAFAERYIGDVQLVLEKQGCRREPVLGCLGQGGC